jgi:hypothetical protein
MAITFPTRGSRKDGRGAIPQGEPTRARACGCGDRARAHGDDQTLITCIWCGHLDKLTIDDTWRRRALKLETVAA